MLSLLGCRKAPSLCRWVLFEMKNLSLSSFVLPSISTPGLSPVCVRSHRTLRMMCVPPSTQSSFGFQKEVRVTGSSGRGTIGQKCTRYGPILLQTGSFLPSPVYPGHPYSSSLRLVVMCCKSLVQASIGAQSKISSNHPYNILRVAVALREERSFLFHQRHVGRGR